MEHYFTDVIRGIPEWNKMSEDERMRIPAYEIIKGMTDVFKEEKNLRDLSVEERRAGRMNIILPKVEKIYKTIEKHAADPMLDTNSLFGKAVTYAINRKPYVMVAVKDPELPIHNLGCERGFVRFAVLRNNIRAFSTNKGARSAADYMTVGDTCQANGRNVQTYYRYLIETIPGVMEKHKDQSQLNDLSFLDAYMPWSAGYREYEQNLLEKGRNLFSELIDHNG